MTVLAAAADELEFVHQPRGVPSFWRTRKPFGKSAQPVRIRYLVQSGDRPTVEQLRLAIDLEARFDVYFFAALLVLKPAFARYVVEQRGQRLLTHEFVLRGVDILPATPDGTGHAFFLRCLSDPSFEFVVTYRGERVVQLRVDRDE